MAHSELATKIVTRLADDILSDLLPPRTQLRTQAIADQYSVSRTPVREALDELMKLGFLTHELNRGYFVAEKIPDGARKRVLEATPEVDEYQQLAEDWLTNKLPEVVTEQSLRARYSLTKARLQEVLGRAAREGWAERKDGYGWKLLPVAKTAEAFDQIYRFRMTIEPAAMLEPTFELNREVLAQLRREQELQLDLDLSSAPAEKVLNRGADFHVALIRMSNNPFFVTALERVNQMRRLMEYRARIDRERIHVQSSEHLEMISLLERGEVVEASYFMRRHLNGALQRKSPIAWGWSNASGEEPQPR